MFSNFFPRRLDSVQYAQIYVNNKSTAIIELNHLFNLIHLIFLGGCGSLGKSTKTHQRIGCVCLKGKVFGYFIDYFKIRLHLYLYQLNISMGARGLSFYPKNNLTITHIPNSDYFFI